MRATAKHTCQYSTEGYKDQQASTKTYVQRSLCQTSVVLTIQLQIHRQTLVVLFHLLDDLHGTLLR